MKTEEKGTLKIVKDLNDTDRVVFKPINNTVWLHKSELIALFEVSPQAIHACIESIFKGKMFREEDVSKYDLYVSGNSIKYDMREFNLEVIIAMAFRIDSPAAKVIRDWFISQSLTPKLTDFRFVDTEQNYCQN